MITLENWFVVYDGIGFTANGIVYGHTSPHCPDGEEIHTSMIESAEVADGEIILFAQRFDIMDCLPEVREHYIQLEKDQLRLRSEISGKLTDNSFYLELSDSSEFYFRMGLYKSSGGTCEFFPRISDFDTDRGKLVVILNYIVKYYPYNDGNLDFIWHSEMSLPDGEHLGIIRNSGSSALNIRFSWGKTVIVAPDSELDISYGMGGLLPLTSSEQNF